MVFCICMVLLPLVPLLCELRVHKHLGSAIRNDADLRALQNRVSLPEEDTPGVQEG